MSSLRAPLAAPMGGFRWFPGYSSAPEPAALESVIGESTDALFAFIESAPAALGTDPKRVYLLGYSQGATITWSALLSKWPRAGFISGALVLSGRLMPELLQPATPLGARCAAASQLDGVPILVTHGTDDGVTPLKLGRQGAQAFEQWRGSKLDFRELEGDGHEVSQRCQHAVRAFLHEHMK